MREGPTNTLPAAYDNALPALSAPEKTVFDVAPSEPSKSKS